ncbi:MAG: hypothetical protein AVDCRST_MAG40-1039, partial [uncultured Gemmatimonadaceae bacterium]
AKKLLRLHPLQRLTKRVHRRHSRRRAPADRAPCRDGHLHGSVPHPAARTRRGNHRRPRGDRAREAAQRMDARAQVRTHPGRQSALGRPRTGRPRAVYAARWI